MTKGVEWTADMMEEPEFHVLMIHSLGSCLCEGAEFVLHCGGGA